MSRKKETTTELFEPSPAIIKRARKIMSGYTFSIEPSDGMLRGICVEMPGVIAGGATVEECFHELSFGVETLVASYLVDGEEPPRPATREKRTEQVNVRFTPSERSRLEQESINQGFRGIGDLIRAEMIRHVGSNRH